MKRALASLAILLAATPPAIAAENIDQINQLIQADFRSLSEDLGAALSYKAVIPAKPLGITGFDLGVTGPVAATPAPTATVGCTDRAQFVTDVSVPDGLMFAPGAAFVKTWRLMNVGTCTWTSSYNLVFFSGDQMSGPGGIPVPVTVAPGATVSNTLSMTTDGGVGGGFAFAQANIA